MRDTGEAEKRTFPENRWLPADEGQGVTGTVQDSSLWSDVAVATVLPCGTEGRWKHRLALGKPEEEGGCREVKPDGLQRLSIRGCGLVSVLRQEGTEVAGF